jgi:hypothetical protein
MLKRSTVRGSVHRKHRKLTRVIPMVVVSPDESGFSSARRLMSRQARTQMDPRSYGFAVQRFVAIIASNAPDPDGLVVFPLTRKDGAWAHSVHDSGGGSPFHRVPAARRRHVRSWKAVGDGSIMGTIDANGKISIGPLVSIDTSASAPELCWLAVSPTTKLRNKLRL